MSESSLIDHFFSQKITIKKTYSNQEIKLFHLFYDITGIYPINILIRNNFVLFFIRSESYFSAKPFIHKFRTKISNKKFVLIRSEDNLIKQLFSFFPDTYIHDVEVNMDNDTGQILIKIIFYFYKDRGIAVGRSGEYIKLINYIVNKFIIFKEVDKKSIKIKCEIKKR